MSLEIDSVERDVLLEMLHHRLDELRDQVCYLKTCCYKNELKNREKLLERIVAKYEAANVSFAEE